MMMKFFFLFFLLFPTLSSSSSSPLPPSAAPVSDTLPPTLPLVDSSITSIDAKISALKRAKKKLKKMRGAAKKGKVSQEEILEALDTDFPPGDGYNVKAMDAIFSSPSSQTYLNSKATSSSSTTTSTSTSTSTSILFSNNFIPRSTISVPSDYVTHFLAAFKTNSHGSSKGNKRGRAQTQMSGLDSAKVENVLLVSRRSGKVDFFDATTGEVILEYDAGHIVTGFAFDSSNDPLLVTSDATGRAKVHNVTLWKGDSVLCGKRPRSVVIKGEFDENGRPKRYRPAPPKEKSERGLAVKVEFEADLETTENSVASYGDDEDCIESDACINPDSSKSTKSGQANSQITNMIVFSPRGGAQTVNRKIIVTDSSNNLRLHSRNGTLIYLKSLPLPASTLVKSGQNIAVGQGSSVKFFASGRRDINPAMQSSCEGIAGTSVMTLAFDALIPSYMYVGLDNGDVLAFSTKYRGGNDSGEKAYCKLLYKLGTDGSSVLGAKDGIHSMKGYVVATTTNGDLAVWNTTNVREQGARFFLSSGSVSDPLSSVSSSPSFFSSLTGSVSGSASIFQPAVAVSTGSGSKIENPYLASRRGSAIVVYAHILPYHHSTMGDVAWMRIPLMFVGIIIVFGWNWWNRKNRGRKSMKGDFSDFSDFKGLAGMGRGGGGGGGGFGGGGDAISSHEMEALKKLDGVEGFDLNAFKSFASKGGGIGGGMGSNMRGNGGSMGSPYGGGRFGGGSYGGGGSARKFGH